MSQIIDLNKHWDDISDKIYDVLSDLPGNDLANQILDILTEYASEEDIVRLPCKSGDTVYEITEKKKNGKWQNTVVGRKIEAICIAGSMVAGKVGASSYVYFSELGDRLFLAKEEAEKKLCAMRRSHNEMS